MTNSTEIKYEGPRTLRAFAFDVGLWFGAGATLAAMFTYAALDIVAQLTFFGFKAVLG